ncbi:lipase [Absidia repens]|uniref:Lipase n=1 Tax=Absidia repens TaxID=90262 RepID=A0A1X2I5S1_9FUNG|nr:lipase [Absidia repens]
MKASGISISSVPVVQLRELIDQRLAATPQAIKQVAPIVEKVIPTTADNGTGNIKLTILRPVGSENEILPVAVYLHGGGWMFGSLRSTEKFIKDVVVKAHIAVVYVEYTLSPEVRHPVAIEECYSSILWVHENAVSLNVDPSKLTVFGDSAGGNMTAVTSILLKQRGHGDVVHGQILIYPSTAYIRHDNESFKDYGNGDYTLSKEDMRYFATHYYGDEHKRQVNGHWIYGPEQINAAPLVATDDELKGLPRCLTLTAECDVLCDEGEEYARRLTAVGVDSCAVRVIGAIHGFVTSTVPDTPQYRQALQLIGSFLKE